MSGFASRTFGDYLLLGEIARGGMGVVYQAVHLPLNRDCALKVIRSGAMASSTERARFALESEALASLNHPDIVRVRHAGEVEGEFFLEMELVEGGTLADRLASGPMEAGEAAALVARMARAVEHAHARGILHRDLKPSNVLLDEAGMPRLTDFGLARWVERESGLTRSQSVLGTPAYLAPELAEGGGTSTALSDVYGLGALLYECLTGTPPFAGANPLAVLRAVRAGDRPSVCRLVPGLSRDLGILVDCAMAREVGDRLTSARELADELERWLRGEPIQCRSPAWWERMLGWARRHPRAAVSASLVILMSVAGLLALDAQRRRAGALAKGLREQLVLSEVRRAATDFTNDRGARGLAGLASSVRRDPGNALAATLLALRLEDRMWPWPAVSLPTGGARLRTAMGWPDGSRVVGSTSDGRLRVWRASDGTPVDDAFQDTGGEWSRLSIDGSGRWLMALGSDGAMRVWAAEGGKPVLAWDPKEGEVRDAQFRPGTTWLAVAQAGRPVGLFDGASWDRVAWLPQESREVRRLAFDSKGLVLAMAGADSVVRRWNLESDHWEAELDVGAPVGGLSFGDGGRLLLVTRVDQKVVVLRMPSGEELLRLPHEAVVPARFNPGGSLFLAARSQASPVYVRSSMQRPRALPSAYRLPDWGPTYSRDGVRALLDKGALGLQPCQFSVDPGPQAIGEPIRLHAPFTVGLFLRNRDSVLVADERGEATIWEIGRGHPARFPRTLGDGVRAAGFLASGDAVRVLRADGSLGLLRYPDPMVRDLGAFAPGGIERAAFSPGAALVAIARGAEVEIRSIDPPGPTAALPAADAPVTELRFAPEGGTLAVVDGSGMVRLWDSGRGGVVASFPERDAAGTAPRSQPTWVRCDFSPDGRELAVARSSGSAQAIEVATGRRVVEVQVGDEAIRAVRPSGSGCLFVATRSGRVRAWNLRSGRPEGAEIFHGGPIVDAAVSEAGRRVATAGGDDCVRVWERDGGRRLTELRRVRRPSAVAFVGDGRCVLVSGEDRLLVLFDVVSGQALHRRILSGPREDRLEFNPARTWVAIHAAGGRGDLVSLRLPESPPPPWLPELAEALAGETLGDGGGPRPVPPARLIELRRRLARLRGDDYWHGHLLPGLLRTTGAP